jgi:hypothetical protein
LRPPSSLRGSVSAEREDGVQLISARGNIQTNTYGETSGKLRLEPDNGENNSEDNNNDDFGRDTAASYNPPLASAVSVSRPDKPLADGSTPPCTLTGKNFCVFTSDYPV